MISILLLGLSLTLKAQTFINIEGDRNERTLKLIENEKKRKKNYGGTAGQSEKDRYKKNSSKLSLTYLPGQLKYEFVTSAGSIINYKTLAHLVELQTDFTLIKTLALTSKISYMMFTFDDLPTGVTPNKLSGNRISLDWGFLNRFFESSSRTTQLDLFFGHKYFKLAVDNSSPTQITEWEGHGLGAGLHFNTYIWGLYLETILRGYTIFQFNESPVESGHYNKGFHYDAEFAIKYKFTESLDFKLSLKSEYEKYTFKASSTRGTENARTISHLNTLGIGLVYGF